jgi:RNA 3'-terminal phosphate cyclase (ATP)
MLLLDGSQGEGGGQILRTSLSLSALTGRGFQLKNIRANRSRPGLRPQHLTAVRAVAAVCRAKLNGAQLDSTRLEFRPQTPPLGGSYQFDVAEMAGGGSAGSVSLILQAIMWPLLFADNPSYLTLHGGTHVPFSPTFHYLAEVARPTFARLGATFELDLKAWGWYPAGGGAMTADFTPISQLSAVSLEKSRTTQVQGLAVVTNLPSHIPQRMAQRAHNLLANRGMQPAIRAMRERGRGPGAGIILWQPQGGFSSLGRKGIPAEQVAEAAVTDLLSFVDSDAATDPYLADQLLLPLALAAGRSTFTTQRLTQHTLTNVQLIQQWLDVSVELNGRLNEPAQIAISGLGFSRSQSRLPAAGEQRPD